MPQRAAVQVEEAGGVGWFIGRWFSGARIETSSRATPSMCASVCVAIRLSAQPRRAGRHGGRPDGGHEYAARRAARAAAATASRASPTITGRICAVDVRHVEAGGAKPFAERAALRESRPAARSGSRAITSSAAPAAAAADGGSPVVKMKLRARLTSMVDERARAGHVRAEAAERLAERAHVDVDAAREAERVDDARAARAEHAGARAPRRPSATRRGPPASVGDAGQRREVAVHREDRIGDDQQPPRAGVRRAARREVRRRRCAR